jgi:hypothetical protein
MRRFRGLAAVVMVAAAASGCLRKETIHTLYLSPGGELEWQVEESGVRSDAERDAERLDEERAYILPALIGGHAVARGLEALGPVSPVRTVVLREDVPFHVVTSARFDRIDRTFERLFRACGLEATVKLDAEGEATRLRMRFDFLKAMELRETPALTLLEELGDFRFVLAEGRFIAGGGFDVPDRARARLSSEAFEALSAAMESREALELVLAWSPR